jgi:hypothetical protein
VIIRGLLLTAAVAVLAPSLAFAQAPAGGRIDEACKTEMTSLCADGAGKGGRGFRCLVDNQAKLGAVCATAVKGAQDRRAAFQAACKADGDKLCAGSDKAGVGAGEGKGEAREGGGGVMGCLRAKQAELSKPCADLIAALPAGRGKQ